MSEGAIVVLVGAPGAGRSSLISEVTYHSKFCFLDVAFGDENCAKLKQALRDIRGGYHYLMHLDYDKAQQVKGCFPETKIVLVKVDSDFERQVRLRAGGATKAEAELRAMSGSKLPEEGEGGYDLIIVNETDQLAVAAERLLRFLESA